VNGIAVAASTILWLRGVLSWKLHDGQRVIDACYRSVVAKLFVAICARRFGKTYWVACLCVETALRIPNGRIKVASAFLKDVEEFIVPAFDLVMDDMPDEVRPKWNESKKKYRFKNGAEIQLVGLDKNPNGGRGNYCDLYVFEEAAFIKNLPYLYSSVVVPMTMYREGARILMITTPPQSPDHPIKDFCTKAKKENAYVELDIYKNPMATPELIKEYRAECLTETDWLREYLCQFVTDQTKAILPEMRLYNYARGPASEHYDLLHKYTAMDLGVRDLNFTLFGYYDFQRAKLVVEREHVISGPEMTTPKLHAAISKIELDLWGKDGKPVEPYKRVADNNNPLLLLDLGSIHNMFFHSTSKDDLHAMVNNLRTWISQGRIEIDESCKLLIDSLKFGIWNDTRTEFGRSKELGHYDGLAALMYLTRNIDEATNPIPVKVGFDQIDTTIDEQKENLKRLAVSFKRR
jgi:hypothetical protein